MLVIIKKEKKEDINDVHEYIKSPKKIIHRQRRCVADSNCHFSYDPLSSKSNSLPPANPHIKKKTEYWREIRPANISMQKLMEKAEWNNLNE